MAPVKKKTISATLRQPDYGVYARFYDHFELDGRSESKELNVFLDELFRLNGAKTVVDFACGTGAQCIGLAKAGYQVTACDLNPEMLKTAKIKARKTPIKFMTGDMRDCDPGCFDAAICIFNAIGHLSKADCRVFFTNALQHLNPGGLLVIDILNFKAMAAGIFRDYKYMSREAIVDGMLVHHVRNCSLSRKTAQITVKSVTRWQDGFNPPQELYEDWQMQIYDDEELLAMLKDAGFAEIQLFGPTGSDFSSDTSDSILAVCQKSR
ncbi:class I SAM-dependent methyltransferase [Erysipelotrichia bacterium]